LTGPIADRRGKVLENRLPQLYLCSNTVELPFFRWVFRVMLPFRLQFDSGVPAYRQVVDQVRFYVAAGQLRVGDQVPSIRELARALAVNPGTIVKAYSELEHAGVIESHHGKGYFIAGEPSRLKRGEREAAVREAARRVWLTAAQVGLSADRTEAILADERSAFPDFSPVPATTPVTTPVPLRS